MISVFKGLIKPFRYRELFYDDSILNYYKNFYKFTPRISPINTKSEQLTRVDIINTYINRNSNSKKDNIKYLEIGCDDNNCFDNVNLPLAQKIGVDPIKGGTHRMTSDNFFKSCKEKFDIIFIDGLHMYLQVQRDIINSLYFLKDDGVIIIHDMLPKRWEMECVPRIYKLWNGDVWKIGVELANSNSIELKIFACDYGVGIVSKKTPKYEYCKMTDKLAKQNFKDFLNHISALPIFEPSLFNEIC